MEHLREDICADGLRGVIDAAKKYTKEELERKLKSTNELLRSDHIDNEYTNDLLLYSEVYEFALLFKRYYEINKGE